MGQAWYVSSGFNTAAGAGSQVAVPSPGDTFAVPAFSVNSPAFLEQAWVQGAVQDFISIKSPKFHDNNQGIRLRTGGLAQRPLLPDAAGQPLYPVDNPTATLDATAAGSGAISLLYRFTDLPGISPRMGMWADIQPRIKAISGVDVAIGACPAVGSYSAGNAINSTFDNFQAGCDYALLGYLCPISGVSLVIQGIDTGNVKVGGPMSTDPLITYNWFKNESELTGFPMIPIIAANNKGATNVYQVAGGANAATTITLILALLG